MAGEWSPRKLPGSQRGTGWSSMASTSDFVGAPHEPSSLAIRAERKHFSGLKDPDLIAPAYYNI
jgi:hypothetical protein